jgi:hypothetical protein
MGGRKGKETGKTGNREREEGGGKDERQNGGFQTSRLFRGFNDSTSKRPLP